MTNYNLTDDLSRVTELDWVEGVGDVSTHYEVTFFRVFEAAKRKMLAEAVKAERERVIKLLKAKKVDLLDSGSQLYASKIRFREQEVDLKNASLIDQLINSIVSTEQP